jgi:hypothetical protein
VKLSYEQLRSAVFAALEAALGRPWADTRMNWCLVALFDDAVILERAPAQLERYPFTVDLFGKVQLAVAEPVQIAYQSLKEASGSALLGPIVEEAEKAKAGSKWAVVVIQEGVSQNRTEYPATVLRAAAKLYEGVPVFWNHRSGAGAAMPDPRDTAGVIRHPKAAVIEGTGRTAIVAELHAITAEARERLLEAHEAGSPQVYGLSHTAIADTERVRLADGPALRVKAIKAVESVDIVSFPSAGGRVLRLVAGMSSPVAVTEKELEIMDEKIKRLKESRPDLAAKLSATPTETEVDALLLEALKPATPPAPPTPPAQPAAPAATLSQADRSLLQEARVERVMRGRTFGQIEDVAREALMLRENASVEDLQSIADRFVAKAAKLAETKPASAGGAITEAVADEADKLMRALDGFFAGEDVEKVARFRSIKEAYIQITGDRMVTGKVSEAKGLARFERLLEGVTSAGWANALAASINRQLVRDYNAQGGAYADTGRGWLYTVVPASDFKANERARVGGYGNLSTVAEGIPYPVLASPTDEKASYSVVKRGGIESVTYEAIRNDDVGAVRRIPQRMAMAARRTLYEFVYSFLVDNGAIYDTVALFHADHANLGAAALASATWSAARLAMLKQAEKDSAKRLGLIARHLIVPPDLEETAVNLFKRSTENDPKFIQDHRPEIHSITHATDTNNWYAAAGTDQCEQIELAFLDGREEPEILVADVPNGGSLFAADKIDYKVRHIYSGAVLDFRGLYGAVVA